MAPGGTATSAAVAAGKRVAVVEVVTACCWVLMAVGRVVDGARRSMDGGRRSGGPHRVGPEEVGTRLEEGLVYSKKEGLVMPFNAI